MHEKSNEWWVFFADVKMIGKFLQKLFKLGILPELSWFESNAVRSRYG